MNVNYAKFQKRSIAEQFRGNYLKPILSAVPLCGYIHIYLQEIINLVRGFRFFCVLVAIIQLESPQKKAVKTCTYTLRFKHFERCLCL